MTAKTAPQPHRQARTESAAQQGARYGLQLAAVAYALLRDRRFQEGVILRAIGAVALASLVKNNQARPVRRAVH